MGCDGGTIPRRDELVKTKKKAEAKDKNAELASKWRCCAISQQILSPPIVMCGLGYLYCKVAVLECLLNKNLPVSSQHIKTMKDIKQLKLTANPEYRPDEEKKQGGNEETACPYICPITGLEMSGKFRFIAFWSCGCVMSERALNEIKNKACIQCQKEFTEDDIVILNSKDEDMAAMFDRMIRRQIAARRKKERSTEVKEKVVLPRKEELAVVAEEPIDIKEEFVLVEESIDIKDEVVLPEESAVVLEEAPFEIKKEVAVAGDEVQEQEEEREILSFDAQTEKEEKRNMAIKKVSAWVSEQKQQKRKQTGPSQNKPVGRVVSMKNLPKILATIEVPRSVKPAEVSKLVATVLKPLAQKEAETTVIDQGGLREMPVDDYMKSYKQPATSSSSGIREPCLIIPNTFTVTILPPNISRNRAAETAAQSKPGPYRPPQFVRNRAAESAAQSKPGPYGPQQFSRNRAAETAAQSKSGLGRPPQLSRNRAAESAAQSKPGSYGPPQVSRNRAAESAAQSKPGPYGPQQFSRNRAAETAAQSKPGPYGPPQVSRNRAAESAAQSKPVSYGPPQFSRNRAAETAAQTKRGPSRPPNLARNRAAETAAETRPGPSIQQVPKKRPAPLAVYTNKKKKQEAPSVASDPHKSDVYKSLFTSHRSEQEQQRAHWVTYNPFYN